MTSKEQKKQQYYGALIIDSGAIIKQGNLANLIKSAEKCYTTAAVMSEIRDAKSREALASTLRTSLNDIIIEKPSNESIRAVTSFAKKTGDYRCLSAADMEVMALQYEMDVRLCGGSAEHLRSEPKGKLGVKVKPLNKNAPKAEQKAADAIGDGVILEEDCADDSNYDDESAIDDEATASDNEEEKEVDVDSSIVAQQAVPSPKAQAQPKSWAALVNPNAAVSTEVKVVDEDPVVKNALSVPLGKMNIASIGASSSSLGGQFDDAEESCNDEARLVSDDGNDNAANELDSEFPSLAAAAAVPYDGSDAEQEDADQPMLPVAEMERRKKESLKPKLTKDGRHYNSFQKYKHLVTSGGIGKHIKDEEELQREKELRRVEFAQGLQAMNTHELDELDPEWKNKSRVMGGSELVGQSDEVDDDGEGWVSVDNFRSGGASMFGLSKNKKKDKEETQADGGSADICRAACATTDFAMQNVILQMGMKLVTVDGVAVRRVKQWVTRCGACFTVYTNDSEKQTGRLFCDRCGSDMLERVAASVDGKTGRYILHLSKKRRKNNLRGTKYSLPKPGKGNRFEGDLLLREDQLMMGAWHLKVKKGSKEVQSIFGSDIASGVGLDMTKRADVKVGFGRRNPNASKFGRERRGKKKKNTQAKACGLRRNF